MRGGRFHAGNRLLTSGHCMRLNEDVFSNCSGMTVCCRAYIECVFFCLERAVLLKKMKSGWTYSCAFWSFCFKHNESITHVTCWVLHEHHLADNDTGRNLSELPVGGSTSRSDSTRSHCNKHRDLEQTDVEINVSNQRRVLHAHTTRVVRQMPNVTDGDMTEARWRGMLGRPTSGQLGSAIYRVM